MAVRERIIPVLVCDDVAAAHDFLVEAFGCTTGGVHRDAAGLAVHAELLFGGSVVWLHRAAIEMNLGSERTTTTASTGLVVHVANVDEHFQRAKASGAQIDSEPQDTFYGQREYGARDLDGHRWWFSSPKA